VTVPDPTDWIAISHRNARSVQTTIGWIFWDPGAVARYRSLGLPEAVASPLGYIAARCAPLAPAGPDAVIAAFGSISPIGIRAVFQLLGADGCRSAWHARDEAVLDGLAEHAPEVLEPLAELGPKLWPVVDQLPSVGRVLFGAHLTMERPAHPVLSGWHAINCVREWRGDTHWALVVASGSSHAEASILHNAWLGYEPDWLARSRGTQPEAIDAGWTSLIARGLATDDGQRHVTPAGIELRQRIEDETDRLTTQPWQLLGEADSIEFAERFEPPCRRLLARVDVTAGPNYQPASRTRG
jgi:hypothetical protein